MRLGGISAAVAVTAELLANAVTPDRDFGLSLVRLPQGVRIEVTATHPERPPKRAVTPTGPDALEAETGRGLLLVAAYGDGRQDELR
ncbi:ATP-binding protein [Streptomyces griseoluteus]|uniref:ATP-binding protein n=1 Tax=Streptomyces griseoluteus TaxID=29306 RepID=UPI0033D5A996